MNQQTYFHVYPDKGVGVEAPLGWSLSQDSQENLFSQLQSNNNRSELCALAELLTTQKRPCQDLPLATYVDVDNRLRTGSWFVWLLVLVSIAALATWWLWGRRLRERRGRRCSNPSDVLLSSRAAVAAAADRLGEMKESSRRRIRMLAH